MPRRVAVLPKSLIEYDMVKDDDHATLWSA
jgi:hypothetical protein